MYDNTVKKTPHSPWTVVLAIMTFNPLDLPRVIQTAGHQKINCAQSRQTSDRLHLRAGRLTVGSSGQTTVPCETVRCSIFKLGWLLRAISNQSPETLGHSSYAKSLVSMVRVLLRMALADIQQACFDLSATRRQQQPIV